MSCSFMEASYALIGSAPNGRKGLLSWHTNQLEAHRALRDLKRDGGKGKVVPAPGGLLSDAHKDEVWKTIMLDWFD